MEWGCRGRVTGYNAVRKLVRTFPEQSRKGGRRRLLSSDRNKAATWPEGRVAYSFLFRFPDYSPFPHSQGDLATSTCVCTRPAFLFVFFQSRTLFVYCSPPKNRPALERACSSCVVQLRQGRKSVKRSHVLSFLSSACHSLQKSSKLACQILTFKNSPIESGSKSRM